MSTLGDILKKEVDLAALLEGIDFSDEQVIDAAKAQANLYEQAARFRIQRMKRRSSAELQLEFLQAEKATATRTEFKESGDKYTEAQIKEALATDDELIAAKKKLATMEMYEEYSKLLLSLLQMRKESLRIVADWVGVEGFRERAAMVTEGLRKKRDELKRKYPKGG